MDAEIVVYGTYWCPDCRRNKRFLSEHQIAYKWVDIEQDEPARAYVEELNEGSGQKSANRNFQRPVCPAFLPPATRAPVLPNKSLLLPAKELRLLCLLENI